MRTVDSGRHPRLSDMEGFLVVFKPIGFVEGVPRYGIGHAGTVRVMECDIVVLDGPGAGSHIIYPSKTHALDSEFELTRLPVPVRFNRALIGAHALVDLCERRAPRMTGGRVYRWNNREGRRGWGLSRRLADLPALDAWEQS